MLKPYESYKNASEVWLSKVPTHWEIKRIKQVFYNRSEKNSPIKTTQILSLSAKNGVELHSEKKDKSGNKPKADFEKYNVAYKNDLLVNCMNVVSGSSGLSKWCGAISPVYYALHLRDNSYNIKYYHYLFRFKPFYRSLLRYSKGILMHETEDGNLNTVRMRISTDSLNNINIPIPPKEEQDQIAKYLDLQIAKINKLTNAKQKQIELLKEQKQAVINKAVTKGLDDTVTMKDSGIEWLGEVPEHWEVRKLRTLAKSHFQYGANESGVEYSKKLTRYIRITDINADGTLKSTGKVSLENYVAKPYILKVGDILFARSGGTVGKSFLYTDNSEKSAFAGYLIRFEPNSNLVYPTFVYNFTLGSGYDMWVNSIFIQSTIQNISAEKYKNLIIAVPPLQEQQKIVDYLTDYTAKADTTIVKYQKEIELLNEYKTSLISSVVTGKVDVREVFEGEGEE